MDSWQRARPIHSQSLFIHLGIGGWMHGWRQGLHVDFATPLTSVYKMRSSTSTPQEQTHNLHQNDVFPVIRQFSALNQEEQPEVHQTAKRLFDIVVLDPPRISKAHLEKSIWLRLPFFIQACTLCTKPGGWILATNNVASVDVEDWHDQPALCKAGVFIDAWKPLHPEEDFPSPIRNGCSR